MVDALFNSYVAVVLALVGVCHDEPQSVADTELCRRMFSTVTNVKYAGFQGHFLIDTGAESTVLSSPPSLIDSPDRSWEITKGHVDTQAGRLMVAKIQGIGLEVFDTSIQSKPVFYSPKTKSTKSTLYIDGILGTLDFSQFVLHVNLRDAVCEPTDSSNIPPQWFVTPFSLRPRLKHMPEVEVELPGAINLSLMLDTGSAFFMTLPKTQIERLIRGKALQRAGRIHALTAGGIIPIDTFILRTVSIGEFEFHDVMVCETEIDSLGMEFIDCFDTVLDFPNREMRLKPLETEWPLRIPPDASGLILSFRDTDLLLVVRMEPDSAAVRSGLVEGDRVLLFDGKSPKDTSMRAMRKRLTEAGTTVKLKILRDGKELDIDLPLSRSYEYPPKWPELNTDADDFFKSLQKEKKPAADR